MALASDTSVFVFPHAPELVPAPDFVVKVNGRDVFVHDTDVAAFASFAFSGSVEVEITSTSPFQRVRVRPLSRGIQPVVQGQTIRFPLDGPAMLSIELDDRLRRPLFLFADAPEEKAPRPDDPAAIYFAPGKVHDAGLIELKDNQTIYIAGGAVVRGAICGRGVRNVRICGQGILDGRRWKKHEHNMVRLVRCANISLEGITIVGSPSWTVVPSGCDDIDIRDIRIIGWRDNDDGIDVVGSQRVRIERCFVRTKDDCIAIKAVDYTEKAGLRDVRDVRVTESVFWNAQWGNALEIGFETRTETISDILFQNCDVIRCEFEGYYSGGTFTIHNGDRAVVSNVRYEDIRVEDSREKLIDFKVQHSHYSKDTQRGQIRDIHVKNVHIVDGELPPSIIQSFDREHRVENVTIENLRVHGKLVRSQVEARLIAERAVNVRVVADEA